jgi:hypothetical protein
VCFVGDLAFLFVQNTDKQIPGFLTIDAGMVQANVGHEVTLLTSS